MADVLISTQLNSFEKDINFYFLSDIIRSFVINYHEKLNQFNLEDYETKKLINQLNDIVNYTANTMIESKSANETIIIKIELEETNKTNNYKFNITMSKSHIAIHNIAFKIDE